MPTELPSLDQARQSWRQGQNQRQLQSAAQTAPIDYDRAARIFYVQGHTSLPSQVIDRDLDNLYEQVKRNEFNYRNYTDQLNGAPVFNTWAASDPYHPVVVDRDRRNLTLMERQFDSIWRGARRGDAMIELARISNRRRAGDEREGDEEVMEDLRMLVEAGDYGLDGWASVLVETGVQGKIQAYILGESWELAAAGAAQGALLSSWGGVTVLGGAGIGFGVGWRVGAFDASRKLEQGLAYDEYMQLGLDEESARTVSGLVGVANGTLELVGLNAIVKYIPGARRIQGQLGKSMVDRMFQQPTVRGAVTRLTARYGEVMATEIATEVLQESITMAGAEYLKAEAREAGDIRPETAAMTWEGYVDAVGEIFEQTIKGTLIIGGIGPGASFFHDLGRARVARGNGAFVRGLGESAENSETRKNVPNKYREYLQAQQEKGPVKELRFNLASWQEYWEGQGINVDEVNESLGLDSMEILEATGEDVILDLETFGTKLAHTKHFQELWKDVRLRPDDMTYREAKDFLANPEDHINRLKEDLAETFGAEVSDDFDRIVDDVSGQLQGLDFDRPAAEQQARLMAAVFTTQALRNPAAQATPWELYMQRLGGVRRDIRDIETLPPGAVDLSVDPLLDRIRANDFPTQRDMRGQSMIEAIVKAGGLVDDGGELSARDWKNQMRPGLISRQGDTLDGMAETLHEQGYLPARDPDLLLEMMERELNEGEPVFAGGFENSELVQLNEDLMALQEYLESEGINVEEMTNQEIRQQLERRTTFEQTDKQSLADLTELIVATLGSDIAGEAYASDLAKLAASMPRIQEKQDLGDLEFTDRVTVKGRPGTRKRKAQKVFDQEVKKRNTLKTLLDCMSG